MKNKVVKALLVTALAAILALTFGVTVSAAGPMTGKGNRGSQPVAVQPALSDTEKESLVFMREEEKLARDVYLYLGQQYDLAVFTNIAASEQQHMDTIYKLLVKYGLADPAAGLAEGVFRNPDLQALYDQLIAQGSQSLEEALKAGVLVETTDIADLQSGLTVNTHSDIRNVYTNLLRASNNHLRAFNRELALVSAG